METDSQKKREQQLEKCLRTPKSIISRERFSEADTQETNWLINTFLAGKFYLFDASDSQSNPHAHDHSELEEIYQREQTLSDLKSTIKEWIVGVAKETGMEESLAKDEEARIFPFGSHRLGVNSRGGDIDTVVLCPSYVDRNKHFFEDLFNILKNDPHAEGLIKVNDPRVLVPVITMTYRGIPIDLAFAKIDLVDKKLKNLKNLNDNDLLSTMDDKMVYSVNGPRNVDMIIQSVDSKEDQVKISNFRTTLKLLKLWAKNKGIYSNAMGYVTGISLAILVAKICQLFPNLKPNKLVPKFFQYYSIWNWDEFPVKIEEIKTYENLEKFNDMQWYDPSSEIGAEKIAQKKKDEFTSPMMVITPAFPVMNSTKKVTRTNLDIMKEQLLQGKEIIMQKPINWHKLFSKIDFFDQYNNFIEVGVVGNDENEFHRWSGLIESQMIVLTKNLETKIDYQGASHDVRLHPYPVGFDRSDKDFKYCCCYYYGLKFLKPQKESEPYLDLSEAAYEFIYRQMGKREEGQFRAVNLRILHLLRKELPPVVFGQEEEMKAVDETTKNVGNLGKRPLEGMHENEFEPNIIKKVLTHGREDNEVKSANFTNSTTGSPHEEHDNYNGHGSIGNRGQDAGGTIAIAMTNNKENMEEKVKKPQVGGQFGNGKVGVKNEGVKPPIATSVLGGKTNFKPIDTSSLLKQGDELDDFL